jgi:hypothetical protein
MLGNPVGDDVGDDGDDDADDEFGADGEELGVWVGVDPVPPLPVV